MGLERWYVTHFLRKGTNLVLCFVPCLSKERELKPQSTPYSTVNTVRLSLRTHFPDIRIFQYSFIGHEIIGRRILKSTRKVQKQMYFLKIAIYIVEIDNRYFRPWGPWKFSGYCQLWGLIYLYSPLNKLVEYILFVKKKFTNSTDLFRDFFLIKDILPTRQTIKNEYGWTQPDAD